MLYGQHIHVEEQPAQCQLCTQRAIAEVFYASGQSCGLFCLHCGREKLERLQLLERLFTQGTTDNR